MNNDYNKGMLDEKTNNLQSQNNLTYDFSALDKVATEEDKVKSGQFKAKKCQSFSFWSN